MLGNLGNWAGIQFNYPQVPFPVPHPTHPQIPLSPPEQSMSTESLSRDLLLDDIKLGQPGIL